MANPLTLSSFVQLRYIIDNRQEWEGFVRRDLETLTSLAQIDFQSKYYFNEIDGKFYKSSWTIADNIKGWIGEWAAQWVARGEEIAYRNLWRLSINDSIRGIVGAKHQIHGTLAMASRTLQENESAAVIDLLTLEQQISAIRSKLLEASQGLNRLKATYENEEWKKLELDPVVENFCGELERSAADVLAQITRRKESQAATAAGPPSMLDQGALIEDERKRAPETSSVPNSASNSPERNHILVEGESNHAASPAPQPSSSVLSASLVPFPAPYLWPIGREQNQFNLRCIKIFKLMKRYFEEQQARLLAEAKAKPKGGFLVDKRNPSKHWTILVTSEERIYFHYHISIVPKGTGGQYKSDKRGYLWSLGMDIAKLSTKISGAHIHALALNEEKFLRICMQKNLPHIATTFDILWKEEAGKLKQIIYQKYYVHGSLDKSRARLKDNPQKLKQILLNVLKGIVALHGEKIVHRDIKPDNILLDENDVAYLGDLGFACFQGESLMGLGSPAYIDPVSLESIDPEKAEYYSDIWSFGMLMYGLLTNPVDRMPWPWLKGAKGLRDVAPMTKASKEQQFPEPSQTDVWMHSCWTALQLDQPKRPTAPQLLARLEGAN